MEGKEIPDILPEIKQIDVSNEEYEKIMDLFRMTEAEVEMSLKLMCLNI